LVLSGSVLDLLKTEAGGECRGFPPRWDRWTCLISWLVPRPRLALARLLELFERPAYSTEGIHPSAVIDPQAKIGSNTSIGPHCWIGPNSVIGAGCRLICNVSVGADVKIGDQSLIHAGVFIGDRCEIGNHVIIQPNAVIGGDGFSFVTPEPGSVESVRPKKKTEVTSFNHEVGASQFYRQRRD